MLIHVKSVISFTMKVMGLCCLMTCCFIPSVLCIPVLSEGTHQSQEAEFQQVKAYLEKFKYIHVAREMASLKPQQRAENTQQYSEVDPHLSQNESIVVEALKVFQSKWNLSVTGNVNSETLDLIKKPRCGTPDFIVINKTLVENNKIIFRKSETSRKPRKQYRDFPWFTNRLLYMTVNYPSMSNMDQRKVDQVIKKSFKTWQEVADIEVKSVHETDKWRPLIFIEFVPKNHFDGYEFDGPGGTFAHAYFPFNGDIHLDNDEYWSQDSPLGTDLLYVIIHESGHALGLQHSNNEEAVMYPFYRGFDPNFQLHIEDVTRIQKLYGPSKPSIATANYRVKNGETFCQNYTFDAVFSIYEGGGTRTYGFLGSEYVELLTEEASSPNPIEKDWYNVPSHVDCALTWPEKFKCVVDPSTGGITSRTMTRPAVTYLFRGLLYWKLNGKSADYNYPRLIRHDWGNLPTPLDAAIEWTDGLTYFFKGKSFYTFYPDTNILTGPHPLTWWVGFPPVISAGHTDVTGKRYIFSKTEVYRLLPRTKWVEDGFPQRIASTWLKFLHCSEMEEPVGLPLQQSFSTPLSMSASFTALLLVNLAMLRYCES